MVKEKIQPGILGAPGHQLVPMGPGLDSLRYALSVRGEEWDLWSTAPLLGTGRPEGIESQWALVVVVLDLPPKRAQPQPSQPHSHTTGALWQLLVRTCLYPCFVSHLHSHSNLPGPLTDGNAWAENLVSGLALGLPTQTATPIGAAQLIHALYHQNASVLHKQFLSVPPHMLVRPLSISLLIVWLCGVEGMLVFFLKMQNTQCGSHHGLSSLMELQSQR
jgi:hypothetical protein